MCNRKQYNYIVFSEYSSSQDDPVIESIDATFVFIYNNVNHVKDPRATQGRWLQNRKHRFWGYVVNPSLKEVKVIVFEEASFLKTILQISCTSGTYISPM